MAAYPSANKIDVLMGRVLRDIRLSKGITQKELADRVCVSFQQIQKYESGSNRISISRLFELAKAIGCKASELITAVEAMSGEDGRTSQTTTNIEGLTESETGRRALMSLSAIDDHVILNTVTTLLELFNQRQGADDSKKPPLNDGD